MVVALDQLFKDTLAVVLRGLQRYEVAALLSHDLVRKKARPFMMAVITEANVLCNFASLPKLTVEKWTRVIARLSQFGLVVVHYKRNALPEDRPVELVPFTEDLVAAFASKHFGLRMAFNRRKGKDCFDERPQEEEALPPTWARFDPLPFPIETMALDVRSALKPQSDRSQQLKVVGF